MTNEPRLVVITITPLAARAPYIEVDDASFSTDTDSISDGLIALKSLPEIGIPSIINNGLVPELMEFVPLIEKEAGALGSPDLANTVNPGA